MTGDANRDVVLNVKIKPDPGNAAVLAQMVAEVEAAKKAMSRPADISVKGGGSDFGKMTLQQQINSMKGLPLDTPLVNKALAGGAAAASGGAAVSGGATAAGLGFGGLAGAGAAAGIGLAAVGYSAYDTFFGSQYLARSGIGRAGGAGINRIKQGFADVGNFFTASGDYFDPLGTSREAKLNSKAERDARNRREAEIYEERDREIASVYRNSRVKEFNRTVGRDDFSNQFGRDQAAYSNSRDERLANLYGGNLEGLNNVRMANIVNQATGSRASQYLALENEAGQNKGIKNRTADDDERLVAILEKQRRLRMESTQEIIKGLEATRRERAERAQAIREEGMSQQERFGNLESYQQEEILAARDRLGSGTATKDDRRLLADYGGEETKRLLREQAIADSGDYAARFGRELEADAARQDRMAKTLQIEIKSQEEKEIKIAYEKDPLGEAAAKRIAAAIVAENKKREEGIILKVIRILAAIDGAKNAPG